MTTSHLNPEPQTSNPGRYQPSGDDLLIYEWVKMQGKTQSEVASMFGINQSTVSRIIQRVERWQAHAKARENGRLDPKERLRAQRWLTFERNELILASCLRIAKEMEGFTELSKSVISRPVHDPNEKHQIRTEGRTIDRHGVAARFLRLAWRINMDNLKLADLFAREDAAGEGEAPAELTAEELAAELHQAALDAAEIAATRRGADIPARQEAERELDGSGCWQPALEGGTEHDGQTSPPAGTTLNPEPRTLNTTLHNLHHETAPRIAATFNKPCTCVAQIRLDKKSIDTCIIDCDQPSWPNDT